LDSLQRIEALEKRIAELEQQLARAAVQQALMDDRLLILERNRLFRLWGQIYRAAARLYAGGELSDLRTPGDYARWVHHEQQELAAEDHRAADGPLISVVTTDDLSAQSYPHWERVTEAAAAKGEFILVLQQGDRLSPHALHCYAQAHRHDDSAELLYSDEDHIDSHGARMDPWFKPGWSPELLRSAMYLGRSILYRRDLFLEDLENRRAHHIPRVLYHRSDKPCGVGLWPATQYQTPSEARLSLIICSRQIRQVRECLEAVRTTGSLAFEILVVHHLESGNGDDMRRCVERFGGTWIPYRGAFDFARMNNLAASRATAPYLLFMNDDVLVREAAWDRAIAATLARPEIGIAGAVLEYPNGSIQHAGVVVGMGDGAGHCGRFQRTSELWPWLRMSRDVSAVTGAMLGIRTELFRQMSGFDEAFPVNYNDVDLCLRVRKAGLRVVCLNLGEVIHRESQTRIGGTRYQERDALYKRWASVLARPDEFYSPHLAPTERIALNLPGVTGFSLSGLSIAIR
jgi:GT2 family glycosyltransferase